jgi:hypothetical protein
VCADRPPETLGTITVKAENPQVNSNNKITYPLYPLRRLTRKLASYKGYTEQRVQRVQKLIRFDNWAREEAV